MGPLRIDVFTLHWNVLYYVENEQLLAVSPGCSWRFEECDAALEIGTDVRLPLTRTTCRRRRSRCGGRRDEAFAALDLLNARGEDVRPRPPQHCARNHPAGDLATDVRAAQVFPP
jgi:hypothetical protein